MNSGKLQTMLTQQSLFTSYCQFVAQNTSVTVTGTFISQSSLIHDYERLRLQKVDTYLKLHYYYSTRLLR
jgi:hypothetical protein